MTSHTGGPRFDPSSGAWIALDDEKLGSAAGDGEPLPPLTLARALRDAGLSWQPRAGDRFVIPDRDLDDETFRVSPMSVEVRESPAGRLVTFGGAVEWALDAVHIGEVVWLPTEAQLREALGAGFVSLTQEADGYRCVYETRLGERRASARTAVEAYALALLGRLRETTAGSSPEQ